MDLHLDTSFFPSEGKKLESSRILVNQLAKLLQQTTEFQEMLRLAHLLKLDPEASRLMQQIRRQERNFGIDENSISVEKLQAQLEALPAYQAYLVAEAAARDLFQSVDQAISSEAGLDFAMNARRSGCGCGG